MRPITSILTILLIIFINFAFFSQDQQKDKGKFTDYKNEFWEKIEKSADDFNDKKPDAKETFKMDYSGYDLPTSVDQFDKQWHTPPISQ